MIYLSRSKNGKLMLCQKKPSHWVKVYSNSHKKRYDENAWNCGQVFILDNEIPGSELIPSADDNGNMYCVAVELFYIPQGATPNTKESQWLNKLWVTRERTGFMMLHHKEQPTRMRDSAEWKYKMSRYKEDVARGYKWDCRIKKDGKKWTSWKGHFRFASEFKGSTNIEFDDEFPSKVGLRIPKEIIMPFNEWFNNHRELYHRPYIENKVELIQCSKPKDYHE
jgi:hypothetical protein